MRDLKILAFFGVIETESWGFLEVFEMDGVFGFFKLSPSSVDDSAEEALEFSVDDSAEEALELSE